MVNCILVILGQRMLSFHTRECDLIARPQADLVLGSSRKRRMAAFIIPPVALYKSNWRKIYTSGFLKKSDICTGTYKQYCK